MQKVKLAVCIGDDEYRSRLMRCLFGHYRDRFELHAFSDGGQLLEESDQKYDVLLCADCPDEIARIAEVRNEPILYLKDMQSEDAEEDSMPEGRLIFVD